MNRKAKNTLSSQVGEDSSKLRGKSDIVASLWVEDGISRNFTACLFVKIIRESEELPHLTLLISEGPMPGVKAYRFCPKLKILACPDYTT